MTGSVNGGIHLLYFNETVMNGKIKHLFQIKSSLIPDNLPGTGTYIFMRSVDPELIKLG